MSSVKSALLSFHCLNPLWTFTSWICRVWVTELKQASKMAANHWSLSYQKVHIVAEKPWEVHKNLQSQGQFVCFCAQQIEGDFFLQILIWFKKNGTALAYIGMPPFPSPRIFSAHHGVKLKSGKVWTQTLRNPWGSFPVSYAPRKVSAACLQYAKKMKYRKRVMFCISIEQYIKTYQFH